MNQTRRWLHSRAMIGLICAMLSVSSLTRASDSMTEPDQFDTAYQRIASLDLCMDWLLAYYLEPSRVLALSPLHQRFPLPINTTQWPVHDGSLEQLVSLRPDLVIVGEFNALMLRSQLQRLGVHVEVLALPRSLIEVERYLQRFIEILDLSSITTIPNLSNQSIDPLDPKLDDLRSFTEQSVVAQSTPHKPRLLLLGANGVGTGQDTFEDQLITRAGWQNYLTSSGYISLDLEGLVTDLPDAILWAAPESAALANQFAQHPVLAKNLPENAWLTTDYWRWQCPGPWTYELIDQLSALRETFD